MSSGNKINERLSGKKSNNQMRNALFYGRLTLGEDDVKLTANTTETRGSAVRSSQTG